MFPSVCICYPTNLTSVVRLQPKTMSQKKTWLKERYFCQKANIVRCHAPTAASHLHSFFLAPTTLPCKMASSDMISAEGNVITEWTEPFRVRYGKHDLGLHIDVRVCLLRATQSIQTCVVCVSDTEEDAADLRTPVKRNARQAFHAQSECLAPKRLRR